MTPYPRHRAGLALAGICLGLVLLSAAAGAWQLSVVQVARVGVAASGLGYLLVRVKSPGVEPAGDAGLPWGRPLLALGCTYVLTEYGVLSGAPVWLTVVRTGLLASALFGLAIAGRPFGPLARLDRLVAGFVAVGAVLSLWRGWQAGLLVDTWGRWGGAVWLVQCGFAYFAVSRCRGGTGVQTERRLAWALWLSLALLTAVGGARVADVVRGSAAVAEDVHRGRYDEARALAAHVRQANVDLKLGYASAPWLAERLLHRAQRAVAGCDEYMAIGDIAAASAAWAQAATAYGAAAIANPGCTAARVRWGTALFEEGLRTEGVSILQGTVAAHGQDVEGRLALAAALGRMGIWSEAAGQAQAAAGLLPWLARYRGKTTTMSLDTLLAGVLQTHLDKLTVYETTRLLEAMGWRVFHHGMRLGGTGILAPVDIAAISGGGASSDEESIRVAGLEVSSHQQGYNLVVVDPSTGGVRAHAVFQPWGNQSQGQPLTLFLASLGPGWIVVGAVNEGGSGGLAEPAKLALERLGLAAIPPAGWSHAFIGITGAARGSAVEAVGLGARVSVGVLAANIGHQLTRDPGRLAPFLMEQAKQAPARAAALVASAGDDIVFTVSHVQ